MKLSDILNSKGSNIVSCADGITAQDAARTMCKNNVGCIAILDQEEHILGILTERDILRHFASENANATDLPVNDLMTKDVISVPPATPVDEALDLMTKNRFRRLPVIDDMGRLCGLLTMGDLVRATLKEKTDEAESLRSYIIS